MIFFQVQNFKFATSDTWEGLWEQDPTGTRLPDNNVYARVSRVKGEEEVRKEATNRIYFIIMRIRNSAELSLSQP